VGIRGGSADWDLFVFVMASSETSVAKKTAKKTAKPSKSLTRVTPRPRKETRTGSTSGQFQLHLPDGMRDELVEAAMANGRSLDDEIIHRLVQSLELDGTRQKLSDRLKAQGDRLAKFEGDIAAIVEQLRLRDD
jgi:predicted HicB family RNase H-like nuclease